MKLLTFLPLLSLPLSLSQSLRNPVLWEDHPDVDVLRVGSVFYYSSSTFAYSPGAPLLASRDLATWTPVSHSVPTLNFGAKYNLTSNQRAYVKGIWASTIRYHEKRDLWIWMGCVEGRTYVWTAAGTEAGKNGGEVPREKWNWQSKGTVQACYYDAGLLIDDDGGMYIAHGNPRISVAKLELTADGGVREVQAAKVVYDPGSGNTVEGARMYKIKGKYYIFVTRPADQEIVLRSEGGVMGPYTAKMLVNRVQGPLSSAGFSHQGGVVDTVDGRWFYVAFMDAYPGGRIPVVAPLEWSDGWPRVVLDGKGAWGTEYALPVAGQKRVEGDVGEGTDEFKAARLSEHWEWNHNPEGSKWRLVEGGGLVLQTADVTGDLFAARNTLTRRIVGPKSSGTFRLDVSGMKDGDRAGAVLFRDRSAYIGVHKEGTAAKVVMVTGLTLTQSSWETSGKGSVIASGPTLTNLTDVWFRMEADITPAFGTSTERTVQFSYSVDGGKTFVRLGQAGMANSWQYFTGYRFGVFNFATKALGGEVSVKSFTLAKI